MSEDVASRTPPGPQPATGGDATTPHPHRWRILSVTLLVGFMALLDVSIVNVAIPSMQKALDTSPGTIQWVVSGYALTFGLTLVAGGRLGDAYGRRQMMLLGLVGFVVSSAAVGLAPNITLVIVARLVQGATAGLLTPQNAGIIQALFTGPERARAFGLFGFTVSVSSAAGPVVGGLIIGAAGAESGWRYLFLVNIPIGMLGLVGVARLVPRRRTRAAAGTAAIDVVGAVLLGGAVMCLLYPVVSIESGQRWPLLLLAGGPAFGYAFVRWERRLAEAERPPLLDLRLLRTLPGYLNGLVVGTLYFTGFTGLLLVLSIFLQTALGLSPLNAGLMLMPFALGSAISAPLAGRFVPTIGRSLTVAALAVMMSGVSLLAIFAAMRGREDLAVVLVPILLLTGLGGGAVVSPNITLTLADVPPSMGGAAGGALQTGQRIGAAIGSALLVTVYQAVLPGSGAGTALRAALVTALVLLTLALAMAVRSWRQHNGIMTTGDHRR
ncbi:MAG: MFS transporter [Actinomycetota bacterium]|nr:MFS transporter [Actinomycetota bacterium]